MGLKFDQSVSSPKQTTGDVLKRLADLMIFHIILHGGNPLTPLWKKEPTVHLGASITLGDIQPAKPRKQ